MTINEGQKKEYEDDDPMELVGFVMEAEDENMMLEMGRTFIDEFLRMGWPPEAIIEVFKDPFYRAPYSIYAKKGQAFVVEMIESVRSARTVR